MTLDQLRPVAERGLKPFVGVADWLGLTPDGVSVLAFACAVAAGVAFGLDAPTAAPELYLAGSLLVLANGWLDLVDGALARAQGVSSSGGDLLDHVLDRYADIAMLVGLAAGVDRYALGLAAVTGVLMTSYLGTQIQAVGIGREYGGLLGRADRLALIGVVGVAAAVVPGPLVAGYGVVAALLVVFALVGHFTAVQRFWGAWRVLNE
ncbi:CDP-alcohol phosphatidyltransferase family protein [Halobaculum sp. P14]|uniref:CDP-alcohol phosphatidyltransferase family protein n=1 Tax=Halobaculum sp. P14 TaxID=3421638 RepID=UPI003EBA2271